MELGSFQLRNIRRNFGADERLLVTDRDGKISGITYDCFHCSINLELGFDIRNCSDCSVMVESLMSYWSLRILDLLFENNKYKT